MSPEASAVRIALVAAQWHGDHVDAATSSCITELAEQGVDSDKDVNIFRAPGSLEIPLIAKRLALSGAWDAVIAFGLITDGGIYRHDFVGNAVISGLVDVALATDVPVLSAVLTPQQRWDENDTAQRDFFLEHLKGKGAEAARSALATIELLHSIP